MKPTARARLSQLLSNASVADRMRLVLLALAPGVFAKVLLSGSDLAWQLLLAITVGLGLETLMLGLRGQPLRPFLGDFSAPLTSVLLVVLLPTQTPLWMLCIGLFAAVVVAKHLYGGLGENPFNPAMVGYAVLLTGFPAHFARLGSIGPSPAESAGLTAGLYALGGVFLLARKIIPWHSPLAMLAGAASATLVVRFTGLQTTAFTVQQLFSATLFLAAFFIVTDPVTGCLSSRGRIIFGAGAGVLTVLLNRWGGIADGLPFAVLSMNLAAPWLDRHTRPDRIASALQS